MTSNVAPVMEVHTIKGLYRPICSGVANGGGGGNCPERQPWGAPNGLLKSNTKLKNVNFFHFFVVFYEAYFILCCVLFFYCIL